MFDAFNVTNRNASQACACTHEMCSKDRHRLTKQAKLMQKQTKKSNSTGGSEQRQEKTCQNDILMGKKRLSSRPLNLALVLAG